MLLWCTIKSECWPQLSSSHKLNVRGFASPWWANPHISVPPLRPSQNFNGDCCRPILYHLSRTIRFSRVWSTGTQHGWTPLLGLLGATERYASVVAEEGEQNTIKWYTPVVVEEGQQDTIKLYAPVVPEVGEQNTIKCYTTVVVEERQQDTTESYTSMVAEEAVQETA